MEKARECVAKWGYDEENSQDSLENIIAKALDQERAEGYREGRVEQIKKDAEIVFSGRAFIHDGGKVHKLILAQLDQMNKDIDKPNG